MKYDKQLTEDQKGNIIAKRIFEFISEKETIDLVPWVKDPKSERYDMAKTESHNGYRQCLSDIKKLIIETSNQLNKPAM